MPDSTPPKTLSAPVTAAILVVTIGLMVPVAWFFPPVWGYISLMLLMILFMIVLGLKICGRPAGILINDRNLMSLSRFQMILWTVLILSAFMLAVIERVHHGGASDAMAIALDQKLWALLGISTASLVGTPLMQVSKKAKEPKDEALTKAARELKEDKPEISANAQGVLYANASVADASFTDMFQGDEVGNTAYVDVSKLQMFFFTMVTVFVYCGSLFKWLSGWLALKNPAAFPALDASMIAILGISHAGFLGGQAGTNTPTE